MNCLKKRAMFITTSFLGIGGYLLYQNLKSRIDNLEEEISDIKECEFKSYPYCDKIYTKEDQTYHNSTENLQHDKVEKAKCENLNNELHDEVQIHLKDLENKSNKYNKN